jgi:hypothetical protein
LEFADLILGEKISAGISYTYYNQFENESFVSEDKMPVLLNQARLLL